MSLKTPNEAGREGSLDREYATTSEVSDMRSGTVYSYVRVGKLHDTRAMVPVECAYVPGASSDNIRE